MLLSYKYRVEPNKAQRAMLAEMLADFCDLYNAGLQQRCEAYQRRGVSITYKMQSAELRAVRTEAALARWSFSAEQQVLRRLDKTFKAFFHRGHGFPRFRSKARFHATEMRALVMALPCARTASSVLLAFPANSAFAGIACCRANRHRQSSPARTANGT